jgi:hypothetical protein
MRIPLRHVGRIQTFLDLQQVGRDLGLKFGGNRVQLSQDIFNAMHVWPNSHSRRFDRRIEVLIAPQGV